jgi:hypothetical protein
MPAWAACWNSSSAIPPAASASEGSVFGQIVSGTRGWQARGGARAKQEKPRQIQNAKYNSHLLAPSNAGVFFDADWDGNRSSSVFGTLPRGDLRSKVIQLDQDSIVGGFNWLGLDLVVTREFEAIGRSSSADARG